MPATTHRARAHSPAGVVDARSDYHHGALRSALLDAAEATLLESGIEAFSLRECARRAGVSHGAPAHHFGSAKGLLTAFAAVGFERMSERMQQYADAAGADRSARLVAVGQAYIDFALDHPAHFRLMFRSDRLNREDPGLRRAGEAAAQALSWALSDALTPHQPAPAVLQDRCLLAWSTVHGLAMLILDANLVPWGVADRSARQAREPVLRMLRRLLDALLAAEPAA